MTTIVTNAVSVPPVFVADTVYTAEEVIAVGVPQIVPLLDPKFRPDGTDGEIDHVTTAPPLTVGVVEVIATSFVSVYDVGEYAIIGRASLTTIVISVVSVPPLLVAVIV